MVYERRAKISLFSSWEFVMVAIGIHLATDEYLLGGFRLVCLFFFSETPTQVPNSQKDLALQDLTPHMYKTETADEIRAGATNTDQPL